MNAPPKALVLDIDGVARTNSRDPNSPFYRILRPHMSIIKPGVREAFEIIIALDIPFYIATKQRGFSDGTLTQEAFEAMWQEFKEKVIPIKFQHLTELFDRNLLVEPAAEDKTVLFKIVVERHPELKPSEICAIDDSWGEIIAAKALGLDTYQTTNLYSTVLELFNLQ